MKIRQLGKFIFDTIPKYNHSLYEACARYVDRFNGDNNQFPDRNGEYLFLRTELPAMSNRTVFDIGANVGDWAAFAIRINDRIILHCFEPSKPAYRALVERRWPATVRIQNMGMDEVEGIRHLNVVGECSGMNSLYRRKGLEASTALGKEEITVTTVDRYCEKNAVHTIDLMKVDVEGHELAVFRGAHRMFADGRIRMIQFEYGGCNLDARVYLADIWEYLEPFGFTFHKLYPEGRRHVATYRQSLETFKYSNWVAVHQGSR